MGIPRKLNGTIEGRLLRLCRPAVRKGYAFPVLEPSSLSLEFCGSAAKRQGRKTAHRKRGGWGSASERHSLSEQQSGGAADYKVMDLAWNGHSRRDRARTK